VIACYRSRTTVQLPTWNPTEARGDSLGTVNGRTRVLKSHRTEEVRQTATAANETESFRRVERHRRSSTIDTRPMRSVRMMCAPKGQLTLRNALVSTKVTLLTGSNHSPVQCPKTEE
jgi:hypothetical protein